MDEANNHPTLHPTLILEVYEVLEHVDMLWMGIWVHYYIFMPCRWRGNFVKLGVMVSPNDIIVFCFGAVTNPTLHLTSTLDVYEVFEHLHML